MALHPRHETALRAYAEELGVDPDLAIAVGEQESGTLGEKAVSKKGARGVMQVMPETSKELASKYGTDTRRQGVGYLADLSRQFQDIPENQRESFVLAAYNAGPGRVRRAQERAKRAGQDATQFEAISAHLPAETRAYVPGVAGRRKTEDQMEAELAALAGEGTEEGGDDEARMEAELAALAEKPGKVPAAAAEPKRGFGEALYEKTIGRTARAADIALGGLPSAAAGAAGALSAGDETLAQEAITAGGGTKERLMGVGLGLLELALAGKAPGAAAATSALGAGIEALTGSRGAGEAAEIVSGAAPAITSVARRAARGVRGLVGGGTAQELATAGLEAGTTAPAAGKVLQAPKEGARQVITTTAEESSKLYKEAQAAARAGNVAIPATNQTIKDLAISTLREAKKAGHPLSGANRRAIGVILTLGRGPKSKVLLPSGQPQKAAARAMPVADLIDAQSNLRRTIYDLAEDDPNRRALIKLSQKLDEEILGASKGAPEVESKVRAAQAHYRDVTIPTRRTMGKVIRAPEPETATQYLTAAKKPTRFERFAAKGKPQEVEALRSSFFNDLITNATENGRLNMRALAKSLSKAEASGQLSQMANTKARQQTIKAIKKVASTQRAAGQATLIGGGLGATGTGGNVIGIGAGIILGRAVKTALQSERASRALLRMAIARQGTPGWKKARDVLMQETQKFAPAGRAAIGAAKEENE